MGWIFALGLFAGLVVMAIGAMVAVRFRDGAMAENVSGLTASAANGTFPHLVPDSVVGRQINQLTEQMRRQVSVLSEERDILQHILQNMTTGVAYVNGMGRIVMVNEPLAQILRRPVEQCTNQEHWSVFRQYALGAAIDHGLLFGEPWRGELKMREDLNLDVRVVPLAVNTFQADDTQAASRYNVLILLNDVSQWHRVERMRADFVANVSHELKTPITAILGFAETLQEEDEPETRQAFLQVIHDEAVRMGALVSDLLALSKLESPGQAFELSLIPVWPILEQALLRIQGEADKRGVTVKLIDRTDVTVWADEDSLLQVMLNLLSNGVHYTQAGGSVTVSIETLVDRVKIHVKDTGIGIPTEHQQRIFERFYRVDRDRSRATGGTGLGLAIVKHIVQLHGGEIGVTSIPGDGSDFWFTLSRVLAAPRM